jgi:hypothetical protein
MELHLHSSISFHCVVLKRMDGLTFKSVGYIATLSVYTVALDGRIIMNNELEGIWKESIR